MTDAQKEMNSLSPLGQNLAYLNRILSEGNGKMTTGRPFRGDDPTDYEITFRLDKPITVTVCKTSEVPPGRRVKLLGFIIDPSRVSAVVEEPMGRSGESTKHIPLMDIKAVERLL